MIYLGLVEWFERKAKRFKQETKFVQGVPIKTEHEYEVMKFGGKYAVKDGDNFYDLSLDGRYSWGQGSRFFMDCLRDRKTIERKYGKFIIPDEVVTEGE